MISLRGRSAGTEARQLGALVQRLARGGSSVSQTDEMVLDGRSAEALRTGVTPDLHRGREVPVGCPRST